MDRELNHGELRELLGAYALDALDADELGAVEAHLPYCRTCSAEVGDHLEVAGLLSAAWAPAPDGVWDLIASSLVETPPPMGLAPVVPLARAGGSGHGGQRGQRGFRGAVIGLVAASVAVIGVLGVKVIDSNRQIDRLGDVLQGDRLLAAASAAQSDPSARPVSLRSADGRLSADAVLLADGTGFLTHSNLPALPPGRTYQLWALVGSEKISVGVLGPAPAQAAFRAAGDVSALAITEEVAGGVVASRQNPTVVGMVKAA